MWMAPKPPHGNEPFHPFLNCLRPIDALTGSVPPPIWGASEERWLGHGQQCYRLTPSDFMGTFGGAGNGNYRSELACACEAIISYAGWLCLPLSYLLIRLDGLYGTAAVLLELLSSGMGIIVRSKDYGLLDLPAVAARLRQPPDHQSTHPESGASRALFDCPNIALRPLGPHVRLIVATHPTTSTAKPSIGVLRAGIVYELFLTTAPQAAFTSADVLDLYLHRGAFETVLADEDLEQDTDRWCSRTACGQEFWQIVNQWLWNLRLDLGQHLSPSPIRWTTFAPAQEQPSGQACEPVLQQTAEHTCGLAQEQTTEYATAEKRFGIQAAGAKRGWAWYLAITLAADLVDQLKG